MREDTSQLGEYFNVESLRGTAIGFDNVIHSEWLNKPATPVPTVWYTIEHELSRNICMCGNTSANSSKTSSLFREFFF